MAHYRSSLYGVAAVSHVPKASACSLLAPRVSPHQVSAVPGVSATSPALCMCTACLVRRLCMRGGGQSCDVATPHVLLFARACACLRRWCARQISLGRNRFGALHAGASARAVAPGTRGGAPRLQCRCAWPVAPGRQSVQRALPRRLLQAPMAFAAPAAAWRLHGHTLAQRCPRLASASWAHAFRTSHKMSLRAQA